MTFSTTRRAAGALVFLAALLVMPACATKVRTSPPPADPTIADPFEPVNRAIFSFNRKADKAVIEPVAEAYAAAVPRPLRGKVQNLADNLRTPVWAFNEGLQADREDAADSFDRFLINTVFGLGGLFDVAKDVGIEKTSEDFGQTLATYGVGPGPYLIIPLLGPTNPRDAIGRIGDFGANPLTYATLPADTAVRSGSNVGSALDTRVRADRALQRIYDSADPYAQLRSLYIQRRANEIHEDADPYADLPEFE